MRGDSTPSASRIVTLGSAFSADCDPPSGKSIFHLDPPLGAQKEHPFSVTAPANSAAESAASAPGAAGAADARATATALESLQTPDEIGNKTGTPKGADTETLSKAINRLDMLAGGDVAGKHKTTTPGKLDGKAAAAAVAKEKEEEAKRAVKVKAEDVGVVAEQLNMTRPKASELLKTHGGDLVMTLREFVSGR